MDADTIKNNTCKNFLKILFIVFFNAVSFLIALTVIISAIHDAWNGKIKNSYTYKECLEATNNPYNCMIYTNALFINQININESPYSFNQPKIDRLLPTPLLPAPLFNIETMNKVIKCTSDLKNQSNFIRYVLSQTDGCTLTAAAQQIEKGKAELAKEIEDTAKAEKEQKEKESKKKKEAEYKSIIQDEIAKCYAIALDSQFQILFEQCVSKSLKTAGTRK